MPQHRAFTLPGSLLHMHAGTLLLIELVLNVKHDVTLVKQFSETKQ